MRKEYMERESIEKIMRYREAARRKEKEKDQEERQELGHIFYLEDQKRRVHQLQEKELARAHAALLGLLENAVPQIRIMTDGRESVSIAGSQTVEKAGPLRADVFLTPPDCDPVMVLLVDDGGRESREKILEAVFHQTEIHVDPLEPPAIVWREDDPLSFDEILKAFREFNSRTITRERY